MINYADFFESAKAMVSVTPESEINNRNAISRAYYSTYHAALELTSGFEIISDDAKVHGGVHMVLINKLQSNAETYYVASDMLALKKKRTRADYHLGRSISKREAEVSMRNAERLLQDIQALISKDKELCG